jgi:hypothetical protein
MNMEESMGWRIVKQPNGLYGRFSDIVDDFTHMNLTEKKALKLCKAQGCSPEEATLKVLAGKEDHIPWTNTPGSGSSRWDDCIKTIKNCYGKQKMNSRIKIGNKTPLI